MFCCKHWVYSVNQNSQSKCCPMTEVAKPVGGAGKTPVAVDPAGAVPDHMEASNGAAGPAPGAPVDPESGSPQLRT